MEPFHGPIFLLSDYTVKVKQVVYLFFRLSGE